MYNEKNYGIKLSREFSSLSRYDFANAVLAPLSLPFNIFRLTSQTGKDYNLRESVIQTKRILSSLLGFSTELVVATLLYPEMASTLFQLDLLVATGAGVAGSAYAAFRKR